MVIFYFFYEVSWRNFYLYYHSILLFKFFWGRTGKSPNLKLNDFWKLSIWMLIDLNLRFLRRWWLLLVFDVELSLSNYPSIVCHMQVCALFCAKCNVFLVHLKCYWHFLIIMNEITRKHNNSIVKLIRHLNIPRQRVR